MTVNLWREFYLSAMNPVFFEGKGTVDMAQFSSNSFPVLNKLKELPTLSILQLAWLILCSEEDEASDRQYSRKDLEELFENYVATAPEFEGSLEQLIKRNWITYFTDKEDNLSYEANVSQLENDGLLS